MESNVVEDLTQKSVDTENVLKNDESTFLANILREILYSPMNLALLGIICFLVYKIVRDRTEVPSVGAPKPSEPELPKIRRDFTVKELRQYDGNQPDGRVLVAVNGSIYDVSKGKRFYGPGGPYATFAGRDASRNLATFSVDSNDKDEYDDLSDLTAVEMDSVREWEMQFKEKYELVGKLLRKGEQPTNYDDDEDDESVANVEDTTAAAAAADILSDQSEGARKRQPDRSKAEGNGPNASTTKAQNESTDC
ncbi:membrane-associated progesterone receptor component 1 [Drosophila kikkawai]|uniref:Membrane-associated progesterone receptor component 1 n=1 Tax=Drosophila kikkawai TaxID=30033 RepID=A0A6P4J7I2_DROKI|nr:membrane-associated progesterone receptor component 1 [Drosophila kikkawai]XP_017036856.1 membrane-associated progesterone receptor component 1 [Drosophila kikkawai]XP_017036865.1 membrane-associated progesterone receptor component 1 [Drosophila kikkawai]